MKLSIVTINFNNAEGLKRTLESVRAQTFHNFEHIIVDGASTDNSVDVIKDYVRNVEEMSGLESERIRVIFSSEPDKGIYNAMNKGIKMAHGDYCQFLNSGDYLAAQDVTLRMMDALQEGVDVLYGNMIKVMPDGKLMRDTCHATDDVTLNMFYRGCLNHSPAYIRRLLFEEYGLYDETLKICSDWKFYMQSIVLGKAKVKYVDVDVTFFDMTGISETRKDILNEERNHLLQEMVPAGILKDYERYHFPMEQYVRLKRHHLWGFIWFIERVLFKLEKWRILR